MKKSIYVPMICALAIGVVSCDNSTVEYDDVSNADASVDNPTIDEGPTGKSIPVRSDGASYRLLSSERMSNGNLEIVTRRDGPSGRSFARREVNCGAMTFRYLGEGDTLEEALEDGPNPGALSEAMSTSISGEVSRFACSQ